LELDKVSLILKLAQAGFNTAFDQQVTVNRLGNLD
jgi:hypothetical protein